MKWEELSLCSDGVEGMEVEDEEKEGLDGRMCVTSRRIWEGMMQGLHVCQG